MDSDRSIFFLPPDCETMRQRDNGFYKYYTQYNTQYKSFRNALSRCHTVTRRIDSLVSTLPNYEEIIGQYRSDNGVVTGKTAEKQDKFCRAGWVARYRERPSNKVRRMYSLQVLPVISNKFYEQTGRTDNP